MALPSDCELECKLSRFRRLLYDIADDTLETSAVSNAELVSVIIEITASLKKLKNRSCLTEADMQSVTTLTQKLLGTIRSQLETEVGRIEKDDGKDSFHPVAVGGCHVELLTECLRLLRNACANCSANQISLQRLADIQMSPLFPGFVHSLADTVAVFLRTLQKHTELQCKQICTESITPSAWHCAVQFASNAVVGCKENAAMFWNAFFPVFHSMTSVSDVRLGQYTCCLVYNCMSNDEQFYIDQLINTETGRLTLLSILQYLCHHDSEWGLYISEKLVAASSTVSCIWPLLSVCEKKLLLEVVCNVLSRVKQPSPCASDKSSEAAVSGDNLLFIAELFVAVTDSLPTLLMHGDTDAEQLECHVMLQLLQCLCEATSNRHLFPQLQDYKPLLIHSVSLLKCMHLIGRGSNCSLSVGSKATTDLTENSIVYGVKSDVMRLIGNLVYQHTDNQNLTRELDAIPLILDHTCIDNKNPYIVQWSVVAIRNLCENNLPNQQLIASIQVQKPLDSAV